MNITKFIQLGTAALLTLVATACSAPLAPTQAAQGPKLPAAGPDGEYKVNFPDLGRGAARYIRLTLREDLSRECGLVNTHFEFDSSEPLPQEKLELKRLSECLEDPSRKGLGLLLVGRTDRRGNPGYNQELGLRRAERVKQILVDSGIYPSRIAIDSGGEGAAVGDDTLYSYGYDRRVDVLVYGVVHAPK